MSRKNGQGITEYFGLNHQHAANMNEVVHLLVARAHSTFLRPFFAHILKILPKKSKDARICLKEEPVLVLQGVLLML